MALPHPHGSASGEIAHNAVYDTGVTPGSTGGKFIGFGEEGTSAVANRAHWALSENIDYLYDIMAADRALPAGASWTVPGGGASTFQFTGDVWVGDAGYPAVENEGLQLLFSVLDDQYNELEDGSGNEVRVAIVRDSTDTTNAYKNGFETNAVITFKTVNPTTGADVNNPYTIPAATAVRILYAEKGTLENLPTDSFIKFKVHSGAEVEAGVVLQDGTRSMTGDLDLATNDLINVGQVLSASPMTVRALDELHLQGDTELDLKDQHLSSALPLSQAGQTALAAPTWTSMVGALNSNTRMQKHAGNRTVDRTGSFTFTNGTGQIDWPTLNVLIDGEYRTIAAGNLTAANDAGNIRHLVVTSAGSVAEKLASAILETDIPITAHTWNGAAFTIDFDLRRTLGGQSNQHEITCGATYGADFAAGELRDAIMLAGAMSAGTGTTSVVRVVGTVNAPSAGDPFIRITGPVIVRGYGPDRSVIQSDATNGHSDVLFRCQGHRVQFEDLTLMHAGTAQVTTLGCFLDPGDDSVFRNLEFTADSGGNDKGFGFCFGWSSSRRGVTIDNIVAARFDHYFILGSSSDWFTGYLKGSTIRDVRMPPNIDQRRVGMIVNGDGNRVINCEFLGHEHFCIVAGYDTVISNCKFDMSSVSENAATGNGTTDNVTAPSLNVQTATVAAGTWGPEHVDTYVMISGMVNATNNGMFRITAVGGTTISYINAAGVIEANIPATFEIQPAGVFYHPPTAFVSEYDVTTIVENSVFRDIEGSALRFAPVSNSGVLYNTTFKSCRTFAVWKPIDLQWVLSVHGHSLLEVHGNHFYDTDDFVMRLENYWRCNFTDNACAVTNNIALFIGLNAGAFIANNHFEGFGNTGPYTPCIIEVGIGGVPVHIVNNFFGVVGAPTGGSYQLRIWRTVQITNNQLYGVGVADIRGILLTWLAFGAAYSLVGQNNFIGHKFCIYITGGANQCRIQGNNFTDVQELGVAVTVNNATDTLITGNHFTGAFFIGQAIRIESTAATDCESTQILNNHFRQVQGDGPSIWSVIELTAGGGGCRNSTISGNHLFSCGQSGASNQTLIKADALAVLICNNHIHTAIGVGSGSGSLRMISAVAEGILVNGNILYQDIAGIPAQTFIGIDVDFGSGVAFRRQQISHNIINFFGTNATNNLTIIGIEADDSDDLTCIGNYQREYTASGTGVTDLFIRATLGTSNMFIGNRSRTIPSSLGTSDYPDKVNSYSASTRIPMEDMNANSPGF